MNLLFSLQTIILSLYAAAAATASPTTSADPKQFKPGMIASLDMDVFKRAQGMYFNYILNILKEVDGADLSLPKGYVHGNTIFVQQAPSNVKFITTKTGLRISAHNMRIGYKSKKFSYKESIIHAKGSVDVSVSHVNMDIYVDFDKQVLSNGRALPIFQVSDVTMDLPKEHVDLKIHGNVIAKFTEAFKAYFISHIRPSITRTIKHELQSKLFSTVNPSIADQNGLFATGNHGLKLDWSSSYLPLFQDNKIWLTMKGLFVNESRGEIEPKQPVEGMVPDPSSKSLLKLAVSAYTLESLGQTMVGTNVLIKHGSQAQKDIESEMDTSYFENFVQGIEDKYGKEKPVDVKVNLTRIGNFSVQEKDKMVTFDADIQLQFLVSSELAVELTLEQTKMSSIIHAMNMPEPVLWMTVDQINLKHLRVDQTIGELDVPLLGRFLNECKKNSLPLLNKWLQTEKFVIPSRVYGMFDITDLKIKYSEDYLDVGLTPVFNPKFEEINDSFLPFVPKEDEPYYMPESKGGFTTMFLEQLGEKGEYLQSKRPDFEWINFMWDQLKIFLKEAKGWIGLFGF